MSSTRSANASSSKAPPRRAATCALERRAVERGGLVGLDLEHRAALHELALHAEQRRQRVVAVDQRLPFVLDVEERRHEPVEVRGHRDQQLGLGLALE